MLSSHVPTGQVGLVGAHALGLVVQEDMALELRRSTDSAWLVEL